jgi:hypothetical protein
MGGKFTKSSRMEETEYLKGMIERKMPEKLISLCRLDWTNQTYSTAYSLTFDYFSDETITKSAEIIFHADYSTVYIMVLERVCLKKEDFRSEKKQKVYKIIERNPNLSWEKAIKKVRRDARDYIIQEVESYFLSNAEKFINQI